MKKIVLKNFLLLNSKEVIKGVLEEVTGFVDWLINQQLHSKQSRMRTRFVEQLMNRIREIDAERKKMLEELAEKNAKGEVLYIDGDGKDTTDISKSVSYKMTAENNKKFEKEYSELANEDYIIDLVPSNKEMTETIKDILLHTSAQFKSKTAIYYDAWCSAFENPILEESEEKTDKKKIKKIHNKDISNQPPNPNPIKA